MSAMAWRRRGTPAIGGYWLWPARMAPATASTIFGSQSKSGKPWPRLTAFFSMARADITVKMVVPTAGRREGGGVSGASVVSADMLRAYRCGKRRARVPNRPRAIRQF
ncbi:hypothetical protein D3C87_1919750 [compost metagenome]